MAKAEGVRVPPHDTHAEKAVVGACLMNKQARIIALNALGSSDFYSKPMGKAFTAIARLAAEGAGIDVVTVSGASGVDRNVLEECVEAVPMSGNISTYAARVAELASMRKTIAWAGELSESAWAGEVEEVSELLDGSEQLRAVGTSPVEAGIEASRLVEEEVEPNWLIPHLLERSDRVIVTGAEGGGKSTLCRMVAVKTAAGLGAFSNSAMEPQRVLIVDLENSLSQMAPQIRQLISSTGGRYQNTLWVKSRVQGCDLTTRKDLDWLRRLMLHHRPSLLVIGPLYKMYRGTDRMSKSGEEAAEALTQALDELRVEFDCALWIEAHAPHGDSGDRANWRPRGSTLFLGWPEFGIGLKPILEEAGTVKLVRWRGDRVRGRDWPERLKEGILWPWELC